MTTAAFRPSAESVKLVMTLDRLPRDNAERIQALDPTQSFIVQAPAGSGKTGLLVRRYLKLLANVKAPEEILAITFTRKATQEMRGRILGALFRVDDGEDPHQDIRELAQAVREQDKKQQWDLQNNTRRLKVQTIDSLCHELVSRMPLSARMGTMPTLVEDHQARDLYRIAADRVLRNISQNNRWSAPTAQLLRLVDARYDQACNLLASMLARRDTWIPETGSISRSDAETMWSRIVSEELEWSSRLIPDELRSGIMELLVFATNNLEESGRIHPLLQAGQSNVFPQPESSALLAWRSLSAMLLTSDGAGFRKRFDVRVGFPPGSDSEKESMRQLQEKLSAIPGLREALALIPKLPDPVFSDDQWNSVHSLLALFPVAAAELRLLFSEHNQADYLEIASGADRALGNHLEPSNLALILDYRIRHILMDEVQDVSRSQFDLLEKLTTGWQPDDGRTMFLVGDPMQSIYRFRKAEVSNFLSIRNQGIGGLRPDSLVLSTNFRSTTSIIDWFNIKFSRIFPPLEDPTHGTVPYTPAEAWKPDNGEPAVFLHAGLDTDRKQQADNICQQVQQELDRNPKNRIGILGRTRTELVHVARALNDKGIHYQAIELESLADRPIIQDLMALTRALSQPADRTAWLACLRAPWCGLTLQDINIIAGSDHSSNILELIRNPDVLAEMSVDGSERLAKFSAVVEPVMERQDRIALSTNVASCWLSLSGPACIDSNETVDCHSYFRMLKQLEKENPFPTSNLLEEAVERLWSQSSADSGVQLLTIHKAKGLEFDVVLAPWMNARPRPPERVLLRWTRTRKQLLLAAIAPAEGEDNDGFNSYLKYLDARQQRNELYRLLYVACTRAKTSLHLYFSVRQNDKGEYISPPKQSLLELLWPAIQDELITETSQSEDCDSVLETKPVLALRRLPGSWQPEPLPERIGRPQSSAQQVPENTGAIEFSWASEVARINGVVMHSLLEGIDDGKWAEWKEKDANILMLQVETMLKEAGLNNEHLAAARNLATHAIENLRSDSRADWLFSSDHREVAREWQITSHEAGRFESIIIDRSFVDESNTRWIVDFKFSHHQGSDLQAFLDTEKDRYEAQLSRYATILDKIAPQDIRLGLYFPLLKGWREWSAS